MKNILSILVLLVLNQATALAMGPSEQAQQEKLITETKQFVSGTNCDTVLGASCIIAYQNLNYALNQIGLTSFYPHKNNLYIWLSTNRSVGLTLNGVIILNATSSHGEMKGVLLQSLSLMPRILIIKKLSKDLSIFAKSVSCEDGIDLVACEDGLRSLGMALRLTGDVSLSIFLDQSTQEDRAQKEKFLYINYRMPPAQMAQLILKHTYRPQPVCK